MILPVFLNVSDAPFLVPQPFRGIISAQFLDQFLGAPRDIAWEINCIDSLQDNVVGLHGVRAGEGRGAGEELEHEDAERPVVGRDVVAFVQDHFGGHVLGGAAKSPSFASNLKSNSRSILES